MFYNKINTQDAIEAKGFLLGHSRIVTEGIYINKFAVGAIRRKKGLSHEDAVSKFREILSKASDDFMDKTGGYGIKHENNRFVLAWNGAAGEDPLKLFTGSQMKLNKLEPDDITNHAGIVTLFDMVCDQVVDELKEAVEYVEEPKKAAGPATEAAEGTNGTDGTEEAATEAAEETEEAAEGTNGTDGTEEAATEAAEGTDGTEETATEAAEETEEAAA